MFRKRPTVTFSILVLSAAFANSQRGLAQSQNQSVPDLSGTWELVEDHSGLKMKLKDAGFPRVTVVIAQEGSQIRITQKQIKRGIETVKEYSYYTDGRGETNLGRVELYPRSVTRFASVSGWQEERLLIKYSGEFSLNSSSDRKDEWRLVPGDGKLILIIATLLRQSGFYVGANSEPGMNQLAKRELVFSRR